MDTISNPAYSEIVIMAATQMLKTECLLNTIGYYMHKDPSPTMVVQPKDDTAASFSIERLTPMIRDTPVLRGLVESKSTDTKNTITMKSFPGGFIAMVSARSPASLAMRPIRVLLMDEVDRYPISSGSEGDPISLAKKRTTTFHNRKIVYTSSPTIKGRSKIEHHYNYSDKRAYHVERPE